jgi:hypothetical protein
MRRLFKSIHIFGQVIGLMMGSDFTAPSDETIGALPVSSI